MVAPGLRAVLVAGAGSGAFAEPDARRGDAEHPVCGDRITLSVRVGADRVLGVRWQAAGCPASTAVAALAAKVLVDVPLDQVEGTLRRAIAARGGLARHEQHAEVLVLRALTAALIR